MSANAINSIAKFGIVCYQKIKTADIVKSRDKNDKGFSDDI